MLISTLNYVPGKEITAIDLVKGNVVQSKNIGRDIMAGFKNIAGGEIRSYTDMLSEARNIATARMAEEAAALGADAVINVRYSSSSVIDGTCEIIAYGTAVKIG